MAAVFAIYVPKDENVEEAITNKIGFNANHKVVYQTLPTKYSMSQHVYVEAFEGQVISSRPCNLAAYDDYRPGSSFLVPVTDADGEVTYKTFTVSHEHYYGFQEWVTADASQPIMDTYNVYVAYQNRKAQVMKEWSDRTEFKNDAATAKLPNYHYAKRVYDAAPSTEQYHEAINLLATFNRGKMRSAFRISLATQILHWVMESDPLHKSPLSPKQWATLQPYRKW